MYMNSLHNKRIIGLFDIVLNRQKKRKLSGDKTFFTKSFKLILIQNFLSFIIETNLITTYLPYFHPSNLCHLTLPTLLQIHDIFFIVIACIHVCIYTYFFLNVIFLVYEILLECM